MRRRAHAQLEGKAGQLEALRQARAAGVEVVVELGAVVDEPARGAAARVAVPPVRGGGWLAVEHELVVPDLPRGHGERARTPDVEVDVAVHAGAGQLAAIAPEGHAGDKLQAVAVGRVPESGGKVAVDVQLRHGFAALGGRACSWLVLIWSRSAAQAGLPDLNILARRQ